MGAITLTLSEVIEYTDNHYGLDHYPIFDEAHRETLNEKIRDRYLNRDIGMETIDMFILAMRRRMNEIMPTYNQLYESTRIQFDPLSTVDIRTVTESTGQQSAATTGVSDQQSTSESGTKSLSSNYPQTFIVDGEEYADSGANSVGTVAGTGNATEAGSSESITADEGTSHMSGYQGLASDLLMRYRESIINVDLMIIGDLSDLFLGVYRTRGPIFPRN